MRARALDLRWLVQLRWGFALGQTVVILIVERVMGVDLPLVPLFAIIVAELVSNVGCTLWARAQTREVPAAALAGLLAFDVLMLTALLHLTGGSFNPFNFFYLVHIALAAVVLPARWTWSLVVLSLACFATMFGELFGLGSEAMVHHADQMQLHLQGMWVAFAIAAAFIAYFVGRIRHALRDRDDQLDAARAQATRSDKLASLATLAAGAAHELATPLGTIALAVGEMSAAIERGDEDAIRDDAQLIEDQVKRCRAILDQMSADTGGSPGATPEVVTVRDLVESVVENDAAVSHQLSAADGVRELRIPRLASVQAIRALVNNAHQASPSEPVEVVVACDDTRCTIEVRDHGEGMSDEVLARAGEPFFTTKPPGQGMGLGLFLVQALAERLGGHFELESSAGVGTTARVVLPLNATISHIPNAAAVAE